MNSSFPPVRALRAAFYFMLVFPLSGIIPAIAQDDFAPIAKRGVQLQFVPPPMEGTISMGIYDSTGALVRVLHQDAPETQFTVALNGLITFWDGRDDAGRPMPAGKYRAKGYMIGAMDFEGVAFLGNDWMADDKSPHIKRITKIELDNAGFLQKTYDTPAGGGGTAEGATDLPSVKPLDVTVEISNGKLLIKRGDAAKAAPLADGETAVDACVGFGDMTWAIIQTAKGADVRAYSATGEFIRHLAIPPDDPQPVSIKASPRAEEIYLLEENAKLQRLRTLQLAATSSGTAANGAVSTWKVVDNKTITFSDKPEQVLPLLKMLDGKPFVAQDKLAVKLLPNPLEQGRLGGVDLSIAVDVKGSFLKAGDGLPLCRVSETPNLKWALMAREAESKVLTIFQSDGAVVEQFKATKLANMMSFDAGDFDFDPASVK